MAHKAGHSVKADTHDRPTDDASVTPNWVKNDPDVHRHKHQGTRDHGNGHVAHGLAGGAAGIGDASLHFGHDRLDDHDGIIHHSTDSQHQSE